MLLLLVILLFVIEIGNKKLQKNIMTHFMKDISDGFIVFFISKIDPRLLIILCLLKYLLNQRGEFFFTDKIPPQDSVNEILTFQEQYW